jgi:hypothetical protein
MFTESSSLPEMMIGKSGWKITELMFSVCEPG